jgi:hypothetical protein
MAAWVRAPLLGMAMATLLAALWAGLIRLGWPLPAWQPSLAVIHGPLMIGGFLGTLISLERAVALGQPWMFTAPLLSAAGALLLVVGVPIWLGALCITAGSIVLLAVIYQIWRIHPALHAGVIGVGVFAWLVGNGVWLAGRPIPTAVPWWMAFLVLTIAGERLELSRLLRLSRTAHSAFGAAAGLLLIGLLTSLIAFTVGVRLVGIGLVGLAGWLLCYDIAWRRLKAGGQARFIAVSLLSGYGWLAIGGGLSIVYGGVTAGPAYDATLHAVLLGFVFAMIFAHSPIISPLCCKCQWSIRPVCTAIYSCCM